MATPGGGPDDSVENLQRFISVLTATIEEVHEHASTIEDHADTIEDLDSDTQGALEDLSSALSDFEDDVVGSEHDALEQIQALRQEAREGTDQRLARAESEIERAQGDFDDVVQDGRSRIEEAHSELTSDGFGGLETTMEGVESALAEDRQQAEGAFDQLDGAVAEFETRATGAYTDTTGEIDQTVGEIANQQAAIETDGGDGVTALDGVGDDIDAFCRARAAELIGLYDGWGPEIQAEATELIDEASTLLIEASVAVDTLIQDELTDPAEAVRTDAFGPYLSELDELQAFLEDARGPATGELALLVDDLEKALAVVDTIAELLKALE
jgi:flagellar biosynthesis chaperone FliJ